MKKHDDGTESDRLKFEAIKCSLAKTPRALRREIFMRVPAAYELIACHAGATEAVHEKILKKCYEQYAIPVEGQADILLTGSPYISPYHVNSNARNPLLVQVLALGSSVHMSRHTPLVPKGC